MGRRGGRGGSSQNRSNHRQPPSHRNGGDDRHQIVRPRQDVNFVFGPSSVKLEVPGYTTLTNDDVLRFLFYEQPRFAVGKPPKLTQLLQSSLMSSIVSVEPVLNALSKGFDLEGMPRNWSRYWGPSWNVRDYAHGLSSNFSSPVLYSGMDGERLIGSVDFISDWNNIKTLFKSYKSSDHLSFFLHRTGNSVAVDHLDLLGTMLFPGFQELPEEFLQFVNCVMSQKKNEIKFEGKSIASVLRKEAFHKLLHFSMKEPMEVDSTDKSKKSKGSNAEGRCSKKFLHNVRLSIDSFQLLVGSDVPLFREADALTDSPSLVTTCANDLKTSPQMSSLAAFDLWLDNNLMKCSKTLVSHHEGWTVKKTQWVNTEDLPAIGKFDLTCLDHGIKLLHFIQQHVKVNKSYWLYKAPGASEVTLYNISNIRPSNADKTDRSLLKDWKQLETPFFKAGVLMKYTDLFCEATLLKLPNDQWGNDALGIAVEADGGAVSVVKRGEKPGLVSKLEKAGRKLKTQAHLMKDQLAAGNWLIENLNEINLCTFDRVVKCVEEVYKIATSTFPHIECIYSQAVEKYTNLCMKLIDRIGPKMSLAVDHSFSFWDCTEKMRTLVYEYALGLTDILSCLVDLHARVSPESYPFRTASAKVEWMYLGCRLRILHGDILTVILKKYLEKVRPLRLDEDIPPDHHAKIIELYNTALAKVPQETSIPVRRCFVLSKVSEARTEKLDLVSDNTLRVLAQRDLVDEIYWEIARASVNAVRYNLLYPPVLVLVDPPVQDGTLNEPLRPSDLQQKNEYARALLQSSLIALDHISKTETVILQSQTSQLRAFIARIQENLECSKSDKCWKSLNVNEIYMFPDTLKRVEAFQQGPNAICRAPVTYMPDTEERSDEVKPFLAKAAAICGKPGEPPITEEDMYSFEDKFNQVVRKHKGK